MSEQFIPITPGTIRVSRTPLHRTTVQESANGKEARVTRYFAPRYRYDLRMSLRTTAAWLEAQKVASFLCRRGGRYDSFLFRDPDDNAVTDHGFGVGNGTTMLFQLQRTLGGTVDDLLGTWDSYTKARSNLCLRSQALATSPWGASATGGAASVTLTNNYSIAPDGTLTATRYQANADAHNVGQTITVAESVSYVLSFWARYISGITPPKLSIYDVTHAANIVAPEVYASGNGAWTRVSRAFTTPAGCVSVGVYPMRDPGAGACEYWFWGAQLELASLATRYIATTTTSATTYPAYWPAIADGFEPVFDPVWSGVTIYKDDVIQAPGTAWIPAANGSVSFVAAPASGSVLSWSGSYYRRCRFDEDETSFERVVSDLWSGNLEIVSVLP